MTKKKKDKEKEKEDRRRQYQEAKCAWDKDPSVFITITACAKQFGVSAKTLKRLGKGSKISPNPSDPSTSWKSPLI